MDASLVAPLGEVPATAATASAHLGDASVMNLTMLWRFAPFGSLILVLTHVRRAGAIMAKAAREK